LVFKGGSHGEVIEALPGVVCYTQHLVHDVVKKAAYARTAHTRSFGLQVENLTYQAGFPV
jgi:hypothetical protein